jgi:PhoH-like ATPase
MKRFIIDTCVLLDNPNCLFTFEDNEVIIAPCVINELDSKKSEPGVLGRNSREVSRILLGLLQQPGHNIKLYNDSEDNIEVKVDDYLIALSLYLEAIIVTKDNNMVLKSIARGAQAELYYNDSIESTYTGHQEVGVDLRLIDKIHQNKTQLFPIEQLGIEVYPNEFLTLYVEGNPKQTALCVVDSTAKAYRLIQLHSRVQGINALNREQKFALEALLNPEIELVVISGETGSGKTLLSLAAGIDQVYRQMYESVIVTRKEVGVGSERTPWLPGDLRNKQDPWLEGIYGCLNQISKVSASSRDINPGDINAPYEYFLQSGIVEPKSLDYVRGATYNSYMILEEAQNFHRKELKTLTTRAGKPAKIVIIGDPHQIDANYLNEHNNGLAVSIEVWKDWDKSAYVNLPKTERSELAKESSKRY